MTNGLLRPRGEITRSAFDHVFLTWSSALVFLISVVGGSGGGRVGRGGSGGVLRRLGVGVSGLSLVSDIGLVEEKRINLNILFAQIIPDQKTLTW